MEQFQALIYPFSFLASVLTLTLPNEQIDRFRDAITICGTNKEVNDNNNTQLVALEGNMVRLPAFYVGRYPENNVRHVAAIDIRISILAFKSESEFNITPRYLHSYDCRMLISPICISGRARTISF